MTDPKITAGWCTGGTPSAEFMRSYIDTDHHDRRNRQLLDDQFIDVVGGPRLHVMRTELVRRFLARSMADVLWVLDDDMGWQPDDLYRAYDALDPDRAPIVGGLCFGTSRTAGALFPTIYDRQPDGTFAARFDLPGPDDDPITKCDATGFAWILVHRCVLERMAEPDAFGLYTDGSVNLLPWFVDGQADGVLIEGDLSFCARAGALGFPIHVHTGCDIGHRKPAMHNRALYDHVLETQRSKGLL